MKKLDREGLIEAMASYSVDESDASEIRQYFYDRKLECYKAMSESGLLFELDNRFYDTLNLQDYLYE